MADLVFPDGVDVEHFLYLFWQRKPLLMRGGLADFTPSFSADELAGLACEEEIESRLVLEKGGNQPWEARFGPFDEDDFQSLSESHWTLLVQDVDKHVPDVAGLLDYFRFLPDWRIDDVMVSFAADQGSVGPHYDEYDVFLCQVQGRRRWRIHTREVSADDFIPGLDLRILPDFEAEKEWILEPGDVLYLPPRVAHWGVSLGESMSYSVGIRAQSYRELAASFCQDLIEHKIPANFYRDPELHAQEAAAEIRPEALGPIADALGQAFHIDRADLHRWLGRFATEQKANLAAYPADEPLTPKQLMRRYQQQSVLYRNRYSRLAFIHGDADVDYFYANGSEYSVAIGHGGFLRAITQVHELHQGYLDPWLDQSECQALLCALYNDGHYVFEP